LGRGGALSSVDKAVARLNIDHYRKLLAKEGDEIRRQTFQRFLADEEAKLAGLQSPHPDDRSPH
jgi:hypothetical protein